MVGESCFPNRSGDWSAAVAALCSDCAVVAMGFATKKMGMGTTSAIIASEGVVSESAQSSESMRQSEFSEFPC